MKTDTSAAAFQKWKKCLASTGTEVYEKEGALHHGVAFFQGGGDRAVVCGSIVEYFKFADRLQLADKTSPYNHPGLEKKARAMLAKHFFKLPTFGWEFWDLIQAFCLQEDHGLMDHVLDFLCCSSVGKERGLDWFKWNYFFIDISLTANDEKIYKDDRTISEFFCRMVWTLLGPEDHPERKILQQKLAPYRDLIVSEAFIRAPWLLLPFQLGEGDLAVLEESMIKHPEAYPRTFRSAPVGSPVMCERIQDSPYLALTTRSEVLTILKARLSVAASTVA